MYSPSDVASAYSCWFARFVTMLYFSSGSNDAEPTLRSAFGRLAVPSVPVTNTREVDTPTPP